MNSRGRSLVQLLWIIVAVVLGVVVGARFVGDGGGGGGGGALVDPGPYRTSIEELEAIIYRSSPPAPNDGMAIGAIARRLGEAVLEGEGPRRRNLGLELVGFAQMTDPGVGYGGVDLSATRRRWEAARGKVFRDAPWFRSGDAELTAAQTPPAPAAPTRVVQDLAAAATRLESTLQAGRRSVMRLGEVGANVSAGSPEHRALQLRFAQWNEAFTDDLNRVLRSMPALPSGVESNLAMAHRELEQAVRYVAQIGMTVGSYGVPDVPTRESYFRTADAMLQNARRYLAQVPQ